MKRVILIWLFIAMLLQVQAAPVAMPAERKLDKVAPNKLPVQPIWKLAHAKKPNFIQKVAVRAMERKLARKLKKGDDGNLQQKRTLATISLVSGIVGVVTLFAVPVVGLILLPIALITGIIGLSNNSDRKSRTQSIIGVVLGGVGVFLTILVLIVALSFAFA